MSTSSSCLDQRILPDYEFALRDEVVTQLSDFIRCPILMEVALDSTIIHKQYYNKESWIKWLD